MEFDTTLKVSGNHLVLDVKCLQLPEIKFNVEFLNNLFRGVESMTIKAGQQVNVSINPRDAFGNQARVDGLPVWDVSNTELAGLEVAPDGMSVVVSSTGKVGSFEVQVAADVDLSDGIRNLAGVVTIDVEAGEAVDLGTHAEPIVVEIAPVQPAAASEEPVAPADETAPAEVAPVETETEVAPADAAPADTTTTEAPAAETQAPVDAAGTDASATEEQQPAV